AAGLLGDGTLTNAPLPVPVVGLTGPVAIEAGLGISCAVTTGGAAWCWGDGQGGELGDNNAESFSTVPVPVSGLGSGVASISVGKLFACALRTDGTVWCWGTFNVFGTLGDGTGVDSPVPVQVSGISGAVGMSAGLL